VEIIAALRAIFSVTVVACKCAHPERDAVRLSMHDAPVTISTVPLMSIPACTVT